MWVSVQAEATEVAGYQNQERQHLGMSGVLGAGSTTVIAWFVSRGRPAGVAESATGHDVLCTG